MSYRVLVVDDDATMRFLIEQYCRDEPVELLFATNAAEGLQQLKDESVDVVVTDIGLPDISGEELLNFVRETQPEVPVIVITGYGSIDGAVSAVHRGAFDYIAKPFTGDVFTHRLSLALRNLQLTQEVHRLRQMRSGDALDLIRTSDPAMLRLLSALPAVAKADASVVVWGESGTGKELFCRAVHELSPRSQRPFVSVNCAALPENLIESELFGHVRGAFTSAHADRPGLIEEAQGGTLFFDEVGELPIAVQAKLLRFLQEWEFKPVGSNQTRSADVRVVSATNRDLELEVGAGRFREDLFYRLNVVPLHLPPLRARSDDIALLANGFLQRYARELERPVTGFAAETVELMAQHPWPGNIRELMNRVQRMVVIAGPDELTPDIWYRTGGRASVTDASTEIVGGFAEAKKRVVAGFERDFISQCLRGAHGNVTQAARAAKMDRKNFWTLMKRYGLSAELFRTSELGARSR